MTTNKKNGSSTFPLIPLLAVIWVVTPAASTDDPRFSRQLEYELIDSCIGHPSRNPIEKAMICSCALTKTQENGWFPDYDSDEEFHDDEADFIKSFKENESYYEKNREECIYSSDKAPSDSAGYLLDGRFRKFVEYQLMHECIENTSRGKEKIKICACAMEKAQQDMDGHESSIEEFEDTIRVNADFYKENPEECSRV